MSATAIIVLSVGVLTGAPIKKDGGISMADSGTYADATWAAADTGAASADASAAADAGVAYDTGYQAPPPDELDILMAKGSRPNVLVLIDNSSGLAGNPKPTERCPWYGTTFQGGTTGDMKAYEQVKAVLGGCTASDDGVLSRWFSSVNFAVASVDANYEMRALWSSPLTTLRNETFALSPSGAGKVYVASGFREAARSFSEFFTTDSKASGCAQNFIIWVAGGNDNGPAVSPFDAECEGYTENVTVGAEATKYLATGGSADMLCNLAGTQSIETWVIGISPTGSGVTRLQNMALYGNGGYFLGDNVDQLSFAFDKILSNIVARANISFSAPTVQTDGLFYQNFLYSVAFSPRKSGPWSGNVKKHCIYPDRLADNSFDPTDDRCVFTYDATDKELYTNPLAQDLWTGTNSQDAKVGGVGKVISDATGLNLGEPKAAPNAPYWPRKVLTWRPGTSNYIELKPSSTHSDVDEWVNADERAKLLNLLHGYSYDKVAGSSNPVAVSDWPFGDPIHANSVLFKYDQKCEFAPGKCYLVTGTNDGQIHFVDTYNGRETAAVIPAEVWQPNHTSKHYLSSILSQPTLEVMHRYFVDGGVRRLHLDSNGDGIINNSEQAFVVVGLGRGGYATYMIPMGRFNGVPSATDNPVRPLLNTNGSPFQELREAWGGPWVGYAEVKGAKHEVAAFPSGHISEFDYADHDTPSLAEDRADITPLDSPKSVDCDDLFGDSSCEYYDSAGYADPLLDVTFGPFSIPNAIAYRLVFDTFDLDPNDVMFVQDGVGRRSAALSAAGTAFPSQASWSSGLSAGVTPWVFDERVSWRLSTDGVGTTNRGFRVQKIEYLTRTPTGRVEHFPSIFVVDIEKWNGSTPKAFAGAVDGEGVLIQISRSCKGSSSSRICVDASQEADLQHMTCPISADLAVYTQNDTMAAIYWGDECGQLFAANISQSGSATNVRVRRLLSMNNPALSLTNQWASAGKSKDFRKLFRRVDLVPTTCPGERLVGVYFGTGNIQRPTAFDDLMNPSLNNGQDVVGVFWDNGTVNNKWIENDLVDLTSTVYVDSVGLYASGKSGWFWTLQKGEKMLRDPIVIQGVAYYKTHFPISVAMACAAGSGQERIYAVNNCTAEAATDGDGSGTAGDSTADRVAWSASGDIGGDPLLMVPLEDGTFITHGDFNSKQKAVVGKQKKGPPFRLFNWRVPRVR